MKYKILSFVLSSLALISAYGQGTSFLYQGRLNDGSALANGSYDLRFALYDAATAGNAVGLPLTNAATTVSNGLFTVQLDFGAGGFNGSARWLEIAVRTNGNGAFTTLTSRQPVTSTPYAIQALNAAVAASAGSVSAANISGTLGLAQLPGAVVTNNESSVNLNGSFTGNGGTLTNLQLSAVGPSGTFSVIPLYFGPMQTYPVGGSPVALVAVDINGDGRPDLISANNADNTLTVYTNNGAGGFTFSATIPTGNQPTSLIWADINGDGKPDLVCADSTSNELLLLTNNGIGNFAASGSFYVGAPNVVAAADVNGDGKIDLVALSGNVITVWTNNGTGVFSNLLPNYAVNGTASSMLLLDINNDGKPDILCANQTANNVFVLTNSGNGTFGSNATYTVGNTPLSLVAVDWRGTGHADLITANFGDPSLTLLTNNGSGRFSTSATVSLSFTVGPQPNLLAVADINNDGRPDLVLSHGYVDLVTIYTNDASGLLASNFTITMGKLPKFIVGMDLNGDGRTDLASVNGADSTLTVLPGFSQALLVPGAVSFTNTASTFTGTYYGTADTSVSVPTGGSIRLNDQPLYLRSGIVTSSGLAWTGSGIFGAGLPDGPVLWGYTGGVLGTFGYGNSPVLTWDFNGVSVNGRYAGNGSGLTNLSATSLTGTVPLARLPATVVTNNATLLTLTGTFRGDGSGLTNLNASSISGGTLHGDGSSLTNLNASQLKSGVVPTAVLPGFQSPFATVSGGQNTTANASYGTVSGGQNNNVNGFAGTIGGGVNNNSSSYATVAGGAQNYCSGFIANIAGGQNNTNTGSIATIGGGDHNNNSAPEGTIAGGQLNLVSIGYQPSIGGGYSNQATNSYATVPGGYGNVAGGGFSLAAGHNALALHQGAFVWGDSQGATFASSANDQFLIRAQGGVGINTASTLSGSFAINTATYLDDHAIYLRGTTGTDHNHGLGYNGQTITNFGGGNFQVDGPALWGFSGGVLGTVSGGDHGALVWSPTSVNVYGTFNNNSDRNAKEHITAASPVEVLDEVLRLPVAWWSYKVDPQTRHIGPMAQDFHAAFNVGTDDKHIAPIDEGGVAIAAIQGLNQKLEQKDAEIADLRRRLEALENTIRQRQ